MLVQVIIDSSNTSCHQRFMGKNFSKMKLVKTSQRNSMSNEKLSNIALLSIKSTRAESINLDNFVDEFDSKHDNRRIKLH